MKSFDRLVLSLKRLPGVGPKQAERLAIHLLRAPESEVEALITSLREVKAAVHPCRQCFDFTDRPVCRLCADAGRDHGLLCVVEEPQDVAALERSGSFRGLYHVLHGSLSPLDGIGPEALKLRELIERIKDSTTPVTEVILATDPDTEGEATALYIAQLLKGSGVKVSRIAHGVPLGGDLDYIDERTLSHALMGRREV
ncbi:MAG: recombination mediator RecR [Elusimicrobiota bacterium]